MPTGARTAIRGHEAFGGGRPGGDSGGPERIDTGGLLSAKTKKVIAKMKDISPNTSVRFRQGNGQ